MSRRHTGRRAYRGNVVDRQPCVDVKTEELLFAIRKNDLNRVEELFNETETNFEESLKESLRNQGAHEMTNLLIKKYFEKNHLQIIVDLKEFVKNPEFKKFAPNLFRMLILVVDDLFISFSYINHFFDADTKRLYVIEFVSWFNTYCEDTNDPECDNIRSMAHYTPEVVGLI